MLQQLWNLKGYPKTITRKYPISPSKLVNDPNVLHFFVFIPTTHKSINNCKSTSCEHKEILAQFLILFDQSLMITAMRKLKIILLVAALGLMSWTTSNAQAQFFVNIQGHTNWYLPSPVVQVFHNNYYGYEVAHARQYYVKGALFFDVVLHRGDVFVEINVNPHGHIVNSVYYNYYPLHDHVCDSYCGYQPVFYRQYYPVYIHPGHRHNVYEHNKKYHYPSKVVIINKPTPHHSEYVEHHQGNHKNDYNNNNNNNNNHNDRRAEKVEYSRKDTRSATSPRERSRETFVSRSYPTRH